MRSPTHQKRNTIGLGYHKVRLGDKRTGVVEAKMYPDSGASMTIVPMSMLRQLKLQPRKCTTQMSTLNGSVTPMPLYRLPVTLRGQTRRIMVAGSALKGDVIWMGYPHLVDTFNIRFIDLRAPVRGNYTRFTAPLSFRCSKSRRRSRSGRSAN